MLYSLVSVIVFAFLGMIWNRETGLNLLLKIVFFGLAGWGLVSSGVINLNI